MSLRILFNYVVVLNLFFAGYFNLLISNQFPDSLIIAHNDNNPPFKLINEKGISDGILIDIWELWSEKTGIPVKFTGYDFEKTITLVTDGTADVNAGIFYTEERDKYLDFSDPIMELSYYLFCTKDIYKKDFEDAELNAFKIGVPKGYTAEFAANKYPKSSIEVYEDFPVLYQACENNEIKIFVSPKENLEYYLESKKSKNNYTVLYSEPIFSQSYLGAVKNGRADLLTTINSGLKKISEDDIIRIKESWFGRIKKDYVFGKTEGIVNLTPAELKWLEENPIILICGDPDWPPNSMYDSEGNYIGIIADYWNLIEKKSGIRFKRVRSESWAHTIELLKNGDVQIIDCVSETPQRKQFMEFSDVLFRSNLVMVGRNELDFINGLEDIGSLTMSVEEGSSEVELLNRDFPKLKLAYYTDMDKAYSDVSSGKVDLILRHQSDFAYNKMEKMLTNLKIVGPTNYSRDYKIGVRKNQTELLSIINKSLDLITYEEKRHIFEKWHTTEHFIVDYALIWKIVISAFLLIVLVIYWNRTLAKEISLRKKIQADLQIAMEKAESATKAKSEFLANMSHEIRTPMNAIIGFADLMKKTPLTSVQETYLNTIKSGGTTLMSIINDILDLSKIEANKLDINYGYFDINSLIFDLSQFFDEKIKSKNLQLVIRQDENTPRIILLDELRIRQIFFNLLSNAIKFTGKGQITITSSSIERDNGNIDLTITVEDTGIGIKPEDQIKIFEAFEQINDADTTRKYQGTGLGLTITKKLTELMNGTIRLDSEPGKGSKFTIEFKNVRYDRKFSRNKNTEKSSENDIKFKNAKVLIADDIESNRLLLMEFCKELGLDTFEAVNGREAVDLAKMYVPDMILLDMRMPVMDGYEAIRLIKSDPKLAGIPVIAVTASVMNSDKAKIEMHKFNGYIRKPVIMNELILEMKKYLRYDILSQYSNEFDQSEDSITDKDVLMMILKTKIMKEVETAKQKHSFIQIKELAGELKDLSLIHKSKKLKLFAVKLYDSVAKFDIEAIKILLDNFNDFVANLDEEKGAGNDREKL